MILYSAQAASHHPQLAVTEAEENINEIDVTTRPQLKLVMDGEKQLYRNYSATQRADA